MIYGSLSQSEGLVFRYNSIEWFHVVNKNCNKSSKSIIWNLHTLFCVVQPLLWSLNSFPENNVAVNLAYKLTDSTCRMHRVRRPRAFVSFYPKRQMTPLGFFPNHKINYMWNFQVRESSEVPGKNLEKYPWKPNRVH